jgi:peroxiredoxin Q/BCP
VTIGTPAPPFSLPDLHGETVSLDDLAGSWVVLWWYPKAATPG